MTTIVQSVLQQIHPLDILLAVAVALGLSLALSLRSRTQRQHDQRTLSMDLFTSDVYLESLAVRTHALLETHICPVHEHGEYALKRHQHSRSASPTKKRAVAPRQPDLPGESAMEHRLRDMMEQNTEEEKAEEAQGESVSPSE